MKRGGKRKRLRCKQFYFGVAEVVLFALQTVIFSARAESDIACGASSFISALPKLYFGFAEALELREEQNHGGMRKRLGHNRYILTARGKLAGYTLSVGIQHLDFCNLLFTNKGDFID